MYETTVGDSNPAKKLVPHVASEYDIYAIYHMISVYQIHVRLLKNERQRKDIDPETRAAYQKEIAAVRKDITRMRRWLKNNDNRPKYFWNPHAK